MSVPQNVKDAQALVDAYLKLLDTITPSTLAPPPPIVVEDTLIAPYIVKTGLSSFGWNLNNTNDTGDLNLDGSNSTGAWGAQTHNTTIVGCALPEKVLTMTLGGLSASHIKGITVGIYSQVTQKQIDAVDIVDEGPAAWTHRGIDGTYALHKALGHLDLEPYKSTNNYPATFPVSYWINGTNGKALAVHGWDFNLARVTGS